MPGCRQPVCVWAFFYKMQKKGWHYIIRFKEGSIPTVAEEYRNLKKAGGNSFTQQVCDGVCRYDFVTDIDYNGQKINIAECNEERKVEIKKGRGKGTAQMKKSVFFFLTDLPVRKKNVAGLTADGRRRWKIENKGFNEQKNHGYFLGHLFSKNYQAIKNHYFLIQIGHMISQVVEAWEKLWKKEMMSLSEKHKRIFESFKNISLSQYRQEIEKKFQIRLR